jgi:hypothetical protein
MRETVLCSCLFFWFGFRPRALRTTPIPLIIGDGAECPMRDIPPQSDVLFCHRKIKRFRTLGF